VEWPIVLRCFGLGFRISGSDPGGCGLGPPTAIRHVLKKVSAKAASPKKLPPTPCATPLSLGVREAFDDVGLAQGDAIQKPEG
jgi:hypothetical protein